MQASTCGNCKVEFLSELWVCTVQGCTAPTLRCKQCFPKLHASEENGKLKTHAHTPFDQSSIYRHFLYYVKLYDIIVHKFKRSFGKVNQNLEYISWQIFSTSTIVKNFESPQALGQFYILKELYHKRPAQFTSSPGSQLVTSLVLFSEKMFNNSRSQLLSPTEEEELLAYYFNQTSDSNPQPLEAFIGKEQEAFTSHCDALRQKNEGFDVRAYIKSRLQSDGNKVYFSKAFQNFLQEKYLERPQEQQIFTSPEYTNYVWQNLQILSQRPDIAAYFDEWVENYKQYSAFMATQELQPTLFAFRMWKSHVPVKNEETLKVNDKYFLDNFILSFIEHQMNNTVYNVGGSEVKDWREYIKYLRDFVGVTKIKGDQFVDTSKYSSYYDFRVKSEDFVGHIQKSEQISFNKDYCVEYLNEIFKEGSKISKKSYKSFISSKEEQNVQTQKKFQESYQKLEEQLQSEEGQKFYKIIYNDYIKDCVKDKTIPNKEKYLQFKSEVFERYDEEYIKLNNDKLLLEEKQLLQKKTEVPKEGEKKQQGKVTHEINEEEEELAEEVNSDAEVDANCPCCDGKPEDCNKPECQMMGYCVTCSL